MSVLIFLFSEYPIQSSGYGEPEKNRVLALQSGDIVLGKMIACYRPPPSPIYQARHDLAEPTKLSPTLKKAYYLLLLCSIFSG